jgi:hypothetical protein
MSKRVKKFERFHRHSVIQYGLSFDFTTPSPTSKLGITLIGPVDEERRSYEFIFEPPLEKIHAGSSHLSIMHIESKRRDTLITILPKTEDKKFQEPFILFATHVVRLDPNYVTKMYLTIVNNQLRGDVTVPIWNPHFNMQWYIGLDRYQSLDFSDAERISYGGVTASKTGRLLGYYPGVSDFSGWRAVSMRVGRLYEPLIATLYLNHHPDYKFKESEFRFLENSNDGAIVDGIINNEFAVEFKSSKFNCDFEPVYMSQCILEMACGFPHVDLVKFCERQVKASGNLWVTTYECKEIRIYRNIELEKELVKLCRQSNVLKGPKFDAIIQTEPYVKMRATLENLTHQCNQNATQIPVDLKVVEKFKQYKQNLLDIQMDDSCLLDPVLDRIEKRQCRIFSAFQEENPSEFVKETIDQIQDYAELLKKRY